MTFDGERAQGPAGLRVVVSEAVWTLCPDHADETDCKACRLRINTVLARVQPVLDRLADDLKWARAELAKADAENNAAGQRAEQAEAAVERVRRLCDLTIAGSCRMQAIDQAQDTLRVLGQPEVTTHE